MKDQQPDMKPEWMDLLLGEIDDPDLESHIRQDIEKSGCDHEAFEELQEVLSHIQDLYPKEGDSMIDLTYEQKEELYANLTEVFKETPKQRVSIMPSLRLALFAGSAACLVLAAVPFVQWITVPVEQPPEINTIEFTFDVPPDVYDTPPPPKPKDEIKEEPPEIKRPPSFEELIYGNLPMGDGSVRIGSYTFEQWDNNIVDDIIDLADLDTAPRALKQVAPRFPIDMKRIGKGGRVILEFIIDEKGNVLQPLVVNSSNAGFDEAAIDAIRKWKFEPGSKSGKIVKTRMRIPFVFNPPKG